MILPAERRRSLTAKAQGYAANIDKALPYLESRGLTKDVAAMFQLGYVDSGEYQGRLSIPYVTPAGTVLIKYRRTSDLDKSTPKYLYESGTSHHLFNAQVLIHCSERIVLTEGELDAITVQAYTGLPAVAYPGVDSWKAKPHWRLCFEGVQEILVVADGDQAGRDAAKRVSESLGLNARVIDLGSGQDSNSFIASHGAGSFLEKLSQ